MPFAKYCHKIDKYIREYGTIKSMLLKYKQTEREREN